MLRAILSPADITQLAANASGLTRTFDTREQRYYRWTNTTSIQFQFLTDDGQLLDIIPPNSNGIGGMNDRVAKITQIVFDPTKQTQTSSFTSTGAWGLWMESGKKPFPPQPIAGGIT